ncbi:unnamed protein product [Echinostoma caproni]|uniref:Uncharacterized protein n=1 Tax=Echinostoma caproni TaxID=27848 RepID=A0A183A8X1_9TREM|nr:unnamed protein product [Echinostoma caproni]
MEWPARSNNRDNNGDDELFGQQPAARPITYRSNKFRILTDEDRTGISVTSHLEQTGDATLDDSTDRPSFTLNTNDDLTQFDLGTEEVSDSMDDSFA